MKGNWLKACAPSTMVVMPRACAMSQMRRTGKIWPVRLVMWHSRISLVCGVMVLFVEMVQVVHALRPAL